MACGELLSEIIMTSPYLLAEQVVDINEPTSHIDPNVLKRTKMVNVINRPASGTPIDTYTKSDINAQIKLLNERIDVLAETYTKDSGTFLSPETKAWIDTTMKQMTIALEEIRGEIQQSIVMIEEIDHREIEFEMFIRELMNIPDETMDEQPNKEVKLE